MFSILMFVLFYARGMMMLGAWSCPQLAHSSLVNLTSGVIFPEVRHKPTMEYRVQFANWPCADGASIFSIGESELF